jgi:hypothetical protein
MSDPLFPGPSTVDSRHPLTQLTAAIDEMARGWGHADACGCDWDEDLVAPGDLNGTVTGWFVSDICPVEVRLVLEVVNELGPYVVAAAAVVPGLLPLDFGPDPAARKAIPMPANVAGALHFARHYGQTDGAHHKLWVIDQMVRHLTGSQYDAWVAEYERDGAEWHDGIAP